MIGIQDPDPVPVTNMAELTNMAEQINAFHHVFNNINSILNIHFCLPKF